MTDSADKLDYSKTLYLPKTDFPMRAGLPEKEPQIVARWQDLDLYRRLREDAKGRPLYVLHDGPPYANGNIHIGHALNKILKDVITRSFQMRGYDSNYVPGWDCHGLPIEWKIEEQYRAKGLDKDQVPVNEFRKECREFAQHWITVQSEEFKRLGIEGDFDNPYTTMAFHAEARIAGELLKFAMSDQLYRGSKPVMWSVVERTALAEAEVEYHDYESDTVWVKFPVARSHYSEAVRRDEGIDPLEHNLGLQRDVEGASVVIWTTTPWTIPGNRAVAFSPLVKYALYEVSECQNDFGPRVGEKVIFATKLVDEAATKSKLTLKFLRDISSEELVRLEISHPLAGLAGGYDFIVPMIPGDHVTDDAGTGFVHTAPGHGREDFDAWQDFLRGHLRYVFEPTSLSVVNGQLSYFAKPFSPQIPFTVDEIEAEIRERIAFGRSGGPIRMLMATICLEHFTSMMADLMFDAEIDGVAMFSKTDPALERLWRWHAMEETEHKAVAYDVFLEVTKGWSPLKRYFRRSLSMLLITKHFTANIANFSAKLLEADGYTREEADRAVKQFLWKKPALFGRGWKVWLSWFKPGFHPWDHDNRHAMDDWKEALTPVPAE